MTSPHVDISDVFQGVKPPGNPTTPSIEVEHLVAIERGRQRAAEILIVLAQVHQHHPQPEICRTCTLLGRNKPNKSHPLIAQIVVKG